MVRTLWLYYYREEVVWALQKLKTKAAAGKDDITVKMMNREVLVELWSELFNWCWGSAMVRSMWKSSMVVPVPKMRQKGAYLQDWRDPWHIFDLSGIQGNVFDYPGRLVNVVEERLRCEEVSTEICCQWGGCSGCGRVFWMYVLPMNMQSAV